MKKIFASLLLIFIAISFANPSVAREKCRTDSVRGTEIGCKKNCKGTDAYDNWGYNTRIFQDFPYIRHCASSGADGWSNNKWEQYCDGYPKAYYLENAAKLTPVPMANGQVVTPSNPVIGTKGSLSMSSCWAYKCNDNHVSYNGEPPNGTCITRAECQSKAGYQVSSDGLRCESENWCTGWTGYSSVMHEQYTDNGCQKYRCRTGKCFRSTTDLTCVDVAVGESGGAYCGEDGFAKTCPTGYYVSGDGKTCLPGKVATMQQMRTCFSCTNEADFKACVDPDHVNYGKCNVTGANGITTINNNSTTDSVGTTKLCTAAGEYIDSKNTCSPCPANSYCPSGQNAPVSCPTTYPKSATGNKSIDNCYTDCDLAANATQMAGSKYYSGKNSCTVRTCAKNYMPSGNSCVYSQTGGNNNTLDTHETVQAYK